MRGRCSHEHRAAQGTPRAARGCRIRAPAHTRPRLCLLSRAHRTPMRTWKLPADIDTDQLAPGHAMKHGLDVIAMHCLEGVRAEFASSVQRGDVIVAGHNFGIGSSREQAASVLVQLGVAAVIAPSYSGLYHRNAFN